MLPGTGKNFDQFRFNEADCRQYASSQFRGKTAKKAATDSVVKSAVIGTAVGAAAGALIGGHYKCAVEIRTFHPRDLWPRATQGRFG